MAGDRLALAVRAKLAKATEFYNMADVMTAADAWDAAVSLAVSAAVNASDVICLIETGTFSSNEAHAAAASLLKRAGHGVASRHLVRALAVKNKAQYATARCTEKEATETLKHAERLLHEADQLARARMTE